MNIIDTNSWSDILDRMIIIGGSARSGTTILGKLISSFNKVEYFIEPPMLTSILSKSDILDYKNIKELLQFYFFDDFLLDSLAGRRININNHDDSCVLHVKTEEDIKKRYEKSYRRVELEGMSKESIFCFKDHRATFFLDVLDKVFPKRRLILSHRDTNDIVNSLIIKKWFSDQYLNVNFYHQALPVKIIKDLKVPFWVESEYEDFWVEAGEVDRCVYYCKRILEEIASHLDESIIVNYEQFVLNPEQTSNTLMDKLNLKKGEKTDGLIKTISSRKKKTEDYLNNAPVFIVRDLHDLNEVIHNHSI